MSAAIAALMSTTVLVYAKDPITRAGVASQVVGPGVDVVDPTEGREVDVAVVVADRIDGALLQIVRTITRAGRTRAVIVAGSLDAGSMIAAVDAGARGFLCQSHATRERLLQLITDAGRGEAVVPPAGDDQPDFDRLSRRDLDVLHLLSEGCDTAEIARRLAYSEPTIKNVIQGLFHCLKARNRPHAVAVALRTGLI